MLEKIENSIADAQMVLVGIGAEMEADMDGKDASFYDSLKEQAERDPAAAQLFRFMQAQKKGQRSREELEKSYQKLSKLLEGKNYFIVSLCDDGLIYEAGFDTERVVTPAVQEDDEAPSMEADDISNGKTEQLTPAGYEEKDWQRYMKWLQGILNRKLCILELGAGMEAPQVIRFAFEKITFFNQKAYLYRVHSKFPQLREELKGRGCSVAMHPAELLKE